VIDIPAGKFAGFAVVIDPGSSPDAPRPSVVTAERQARRLSLLDFPTPVAPMTRIKVPRQFNARNPQMRRDLASSLRAGTHNLTAPPPPRVPAYDGGGRAGHGEGDEIFRLREELRNHPCHACPDREEHARWAERWFKLDRDAATLKRRVEQRTNTVARLFDRVCDVLTALDYLEGDTITPRGQGLMRIYSELDLVVAEGLRLGIFDDLSASQLAGVLSSLVFEARRADDAGPPRLPGPVITRAVGELQKLWSELSSLEHRHKLDQLRQPDPGFVRAAYRWAEGDELDDILDGTGMAAGDFVRNVKQLMDLAGHVADAAGDSPVRRAARDAIDLLRRGVVAYTSVVE
jgi:ATP-dependent RNA helicase HelY